jgi:hypothetical protein
MMMQSRCSRSHIWVLCSEQVPSALCSCTALGLAFIFNIFILLRAAAVFVLLVCLVPDWVNIGTADPVKPVCFSGC